MQVNQLIVLPDTGTLTYLSAIFSGCPFDIDLTKAYVEINSSSEPMIPEESSVYLASCGSMNVWYDSSTQSSSLLLPLESPSLMERCLQLRKAAPSPFYGEHYFPFVVIKRHMPPLKRRYRAFINSVADVLASNRVPLVFDGEFILPASFTYVPDTDFYVSQLANIR